MVINVRLGGEKVKFLYKFRYVFSGPAEGAGFGGQRTAAHHKYGKGGGNGTVPQEPEIFMIILQKLTAAPCDAEKLQAVVML